MVLGCRVSLGHQFAFDLPFEPMLRIGGIPNTGIDFGAVVHDPTRICERFDTPASVVFAHSGVADPTEGKLGDQGVYRTVVDPRIARSCFVQYPFDETRIFCENV